MLPTPRDRSAPEAVPPEPPPGPPPLEARLAALVRAAGAQAAHAVDGASGQVLARVGPADGDDPAALAQLARAAQALARGRGERIEDVAVALGSASLHVLRECDGVVLHARLDPARGDIAAVRRGLAGLGRAVAGGTGREAAPAARPAARRDELRRHRAAEDAWPYSLPRTRRDPAEAEPGRDEARGVERSAAASTEPGMRPATPPPRPAPRTARGGGRETGPEPPRARPDDPASPAHRRSTPENPGPPAPAAARSAPPLSAPPRSLRERDAREPGRGAPGPAMPGAEPPGSPPGPEPPRQDPPRRLPAPRPAPPPRQARSQPSEPQQPATEHIPRQRPSERPSERPSARPSDRPPDRPSPRPRPENRVERPPEPPSVPLPRHALRADGDGRDPAIVAVDSGRADPATGALALLALPALPRRRRAAPAHAAPAPGAVVTPAVLNLPWSDDLSTMRRTLAGLRRLA